MLGGGNLPFPTERNTLLFFPGIDGKIRTMRKGKQPMRARVLLLLTFFTLIPAASAQSTPWAQKIFMGVSSHDFGTCPRGAQLKHRFKMKNIYAVPLHITNIRTSCGCMTATPNKKILQPQEEGYVDIHMDGTRFTGQKSINLFVTVGPKFISTAVINVTANARMDVVFNPGEVNFGVIPTGSQPTKSIDVEYAGNLEWKIIEVVKNKNAPFDVAPRLVSRQNGGVFKTGKAHYRLDLTMKSDVEPGQFRQEILLKTNDPASPVLTVCVEGNVQAALSVLPNVVQFGTVRSGQVLSKRVVVSGQQPFQITGIQGTDKIISTTIPAQITNVHILNLQFRPTQAGAFRRNLVVSTNMGNGDSVVVSIIADVK